MPTCCLWPESSPGQSFPRSSDGKESACNVGDLGSILGWEYPLEKGIFCQAEAGVWVLLTELYSSVSPAQSQLPHEAERAQRPGHRVLRGPTEMFSFLLKPEEN